MLLSVLVSKSPFSKNSAVAKINSNFQERKGKEKVRTRIQILLFRLDPDPKHRVKLKQNRQETG